MPFRSRVREMTLPFPTHCRARHPHKKAQGGRWLWHAMLLGLEFLLGKVTLRLPKPGWSSGGPLFPEPTCGCLKSPPARPLSATGAVCLFWGINRVIAVGGCAFRATQVPWL